MSSSTLLFSFFYSLFLQILVSTSQQLIPPLTSLCSSQDGNFGPNSTYQHNLRQAFSSLSSNTRIDSGFYNSSVGTNPDRVTALSLCRGDKTSNVCLACINNSTQQLRTLCPNQKEAIIWYDDCLLRYSNRSILGNMEFRPSFSMYNVNNVSDATLFDQEVKSLLENLTAEAASGNSVRKFATGNTTVTNNESIYGLVQCTPDLSKQQCYDCVGNATDDLQRCCSGKSGGRIHGTSCQIRFENYVFYDSVTRTSEPPSSSPAPAPTPVPQQTPPTAPGTTPLPNYSPPPPASFAIISGMASNIFQTAMLSLISVLLLNEF